MVFLLVPVTPIRVILPGYPNQAADTRARAALGSGVESQLPVRGGSRQDGGGALFQRLGHHTGVRLSWTLRRRHKQGARLQGPAVIRYGIYFHIQVGVAPREGDAGEQISAASWCHPSRVGFIFLRGAK